ncbi:MAG TPA: hypothetical protein VKZ63_08120 [Kofleriaceae bacterium]|nr:hypothetical protein [Kofleriaceae bacterium]
MAFPRIYSSFAEFEREELRKLDSLRTTVDDMLEEQFSEDLSLFDEPTAPRRRGRPRKQR